MVSTRRTTLDGRSAMRFLLAPVIGLALMVGAAPALAAGGGKSSTCAKGGQSAYHQPAGAGSGRRIR
jgi:hypothetical protein